MDPLVFAAVADDDTGASDLAGMLAEQGVRTLLVIDLPEEQQFLEWSRGCQAVVMAEGTRSIDPGEAYERTRAAIRLLGARTPRVFEIKYCSTFDSTERGNIGPTIDAALDELDEPFTIALPALPVNGRTTYMGYHFVHRQLLSDSPMRHHPLTPMTNANLVEWLGRQTKRRVGLAPHAAVRAGAAELSRCFDQLRSDGVSIAIVDCLSDSDLESICRAAADLRLITGSSAPGMKLPAVWRERGWLAAGEEEFTRPAVSPEGRGCLIVAGSCSVATRSQNEWLAAQGVRWLRLDPKDLASGATDCSAPAQVIAELAAGRSCLVSTTGTPEEVQAVQDWGQRRGMTRDEVGLAISCGLAELTLRMLEHQPAGGLIIAGGETSGALCRRLQLGALRVGRNIDPGVPLCHSLGRFRMPVALKSGNFGAVDFYGKAMRAMGVTTDR